jgi:hydrogenase maturation protein HypF
MGKLLRLRITIRGVVQGVGFRPFVYRLASELAMAGWVSNSTEGVQIEAEGPKAVLDIFLIRLTREHPRQASIHSFEYSFLDALGVPTFVIRPSESDGPKRALILPDIGTCAECVQEVFDPANRRYLYPFTNCTNCGPRFTIVESLPYDRANTTMRCFTMCGRCSAEYKDPLDRRFHAQPNACPDCGPHVELWNASGTVIARRGDSILAAVEAVTTGRIVAVKGLGGFHLMVDAANDKAVQRLRRLKHREEKPFALMVPSIESAHELCCLNALEERAITAPEAPIVLLSRRTGTELAPSVAPGNPYLGVMLPYTPLHHILLRQSGRPIVATSGNHSDEPIVIDERDALRRLSGIADLFLVHNRPIRRHVDDSIVRILLGREQILRRARGFAPLPVTKASDPSVPTLAGGAHMKNAVALTTGGNIFLSQHIGDLNTKEAFDAFQQVTEDLQRLYGARVGRVAVDMHPDYASTRYISGLADSYAIDTVRVQHHWAHVLSCLAENDVEVPALGIAWDGTGYGSDGTIWGGEFLLATETAFTRAAHFRTFPLAGGDAAARNPEHAACGVLYEIFKTDAFTGNEPPILRQMLEKNVRSPRTSSVGRLFDAVAYLTGVGRRVSFEGQAAMQLEFAASAGITAVYDYIIHTSQPCIIDWEPMIRQILDDVRRGTDPGTISAMFHNTLAEIVVQVARRIAEPRVALTGGCFQNRYLAEQTVQRLTEAGFCPYWHQRVPPNDGGIALGQAIAAQRMIGEAKPCVLQSRAR